VINLYGKGECQHIAVHLCLLSGLINQEEIDVEHTNLVQSLFIASVTQGTGTFLGQEVKGEGHQFFVSSIGTAHLVFIFQHCMISPY